MRSSTLPRFSAAGLAILGGMVLFTGNARAGLILDIDAVNLRFGFLPPVVLVPAMATGQAVATNTATGATVTSPIPPGGGNATAAVGGPPPVAISTISANLATDTISRVGSATPPGSINGTQVDITKAVMSPPVPVLTGIDVILTVRRDPAETIDAYLGPGDTGSITDNISVVDLATGATLFNSTSVFSNTSPDTVTDSTGQIVWQRTPGFFDGDTGGQPNAFSDNRWVMDPTAAEFTLPIDLAAGEAADIPLDFIETLSGTVSGPSIYGFSSAIAEPSAITLLGIALPGLIGLAARGRRRRPTARHEPGASQNQDVGGPVQVTRPPDGGQSVIPPRPGSRMLTWEAALPTAA